jgi:hypothetical protein
MNRIVLCACMLAAGVANAKLPVVGETLPVTGGEGWPAAQWLYDSPSAKDALGKVTIHWFCAPKLVGCSEDLARLTTLKERSPSVYIVAYIDGTKPQAQKLDPIRGSEGVGRGTVGFGPAITKFFKALAITNAVSFVVDTDNKVQHVSVGTNPSDLDTRDAKVNALVGAIKLHTVAATGPAKVKANEKFELVFTVKLASWLTFSAKPNALYEWSASFPKDIKCTNTSLKGDAMKGSGQSLVIKMACSGPRGSYEGTAQIQWAYDTPSGASGLGADGGRWKFEITP